MQYRNFSIFLFAMFLMAGCATIKNHQTKEQKTVVVNPQPKRGVIDYAVGNVVHY